MNINSFKFFKNPLPPEDVHFMEIKIEPWEDNNRLKVFVSISEFSSPPNLNFFIRDKNGSLLSEVTLIENIDKDFVFTMHLRNHSEQKELVLEGEIFYQDDLGVVNRKTVSFTI
jgi:hypothetical protein